MTGSEERWLFDSFRKTTMFLETGTKRANKVARSYRIHPFTAGATLLAIFALCFLNPRIYKGFIQTRHLLILNAIMCVESSVSSRSLIPTMVGNKNARKWNRIQSYLLIASSTFSLVPGAIGSLMTWLMCSLLFTAGVPERLFVLCVLSQFDIKRRSEYVGLYSPQMKVTALASIPLGVAAFLWRKQPYI